MGFVEIESSKVKLLDETYGRATVEGMSGLNMQYE